MFGSGAGRDRINSLVLVIISSKSDNGHMYYYLLLGLRFRHNINYLRS